MKNNYTIYNQKNEPIAIFEDINYALLFRCSDRKNFKRSIPISNSFPKLDQWFQIEQPKGKLIGYFSKREDASEFLKGEFYTNRVRE